MNTLFRTSLRDWQAAYKARQAAEPASEQAAPATQSNGEEAPKRVKKLLPRRRKKARQAGASAG